METRGLRVDGRSRKSSYRHSDYLFYATSCCFLSRLVPSMEYAIISTHFVFSAAAVWNGRPGVLGLPPDRRSYRHSCLTHFQAPGQPAAAEKTPAKGFGAAATATIDPAGECL